MSRTIFVGALLPTAVIVGVANAADVPPPHVRPMAVAVVLAYNWTGCHIGINGGGGFGEIEASSGSTTLTVDGFNGGLVGGQLGCNFQTGSLVIGAEIDGQ